MVPALFLAHGSPMIAIEDNSYTRFLRNLGKKIEPKAIIIFTAHWESETLTISASDAPYDTLYDFGGFPDALYEIKYPAKGSSATALNLEEKFAANGIPAKRDTTRGLDHGSWSLLTHLYPDADIPVIQVSVNPFLKPEAQFKIGKVLSDLGKEDILIIGSGVTVHNLRLLKWGQKEADAWAVAFDDWLIEKIEANDNASLFKYETLAPYAQMAVPRPEHFVPLFIAMGSGNNTPEMIYRDYDLGNLSYLCFQF